ncbi:hypothetical protein [Crossiella cryophila]|uniref:DUF4034 domain-containing protein n=1 Tax=Crossiella cryophila TaxID=43355 RepID=A0A7W7CFU9_9PSEU|nr:hypothetical protein [Crossiella cryophila]MBB4680428.1 hypothetical protein [Crossiella cryophila]
MPSKFMMIMRVLRDIGISTDAGQPDPDFKAAEHDLYKGDLEVAWKLAAATQGDNELRADRIGKISKILVRNVDELGKIAAANPDDADLQLLLGATRIQHAWKVRTGATADQVSREQFEQFWFILGGAYDPLMHAAELRPADPVPWDKLQWRGLGLQVSRDEMDEVWQELTDRDPFHYGAHYSRVQVLCEKWQGSDREVLEFTNEVAQSAPPGEPLSALTVAAHLEVMMGNDAEPLDYFGRPHISAQLVRISDNWLAGLRPHHRNIEAHHLLGVGLYLAGERERARDHLSRVSARSVTDGLPWSYIGYRYDKLDYRTIRKSLGLKMKD